MEDKDYKRVHITVGGRTYPVKVLAHEMESVKTVETQVNKSLSDIQSSYNAKDNQDSLSMALLSNAFELHKLKSPKVNQALESKIGQIEDLLDSALL